MKKLVKFPAFLIFTVLMQISPLACAEGSEWGLLREVVVEGYVLVGDLPAAAGEGEVFHRGPGELYETITTLIPLKGAEIRLNGADEAVLSGEDGFFRLAVKRWFFQPKSVDLEVITPLKRLNVELSLRHGENPFFAAVVSREGGGGVYVKTVTESPGVPLAFVSMDILPSLTLEKPGNWSRIIELIETDLVAQKPECYEIECLEAFDFMHVPALLHRRISALSRIYGGVGVRCAGFGPGAVALRYYSVSEFYEPGVMECLLQVAPPNKGLALPDAARNALGKRRQRLLAPLAPDAAFMEALNMGRGTGVDTRDFALAPDRMNDAGFNPDIRTFIIAGEIMEESKQALRSAGDRLGRSAGAFLDFWKDFIARQGMDPGFLDRLEDAGRELLDHYGRGLENLPAGDLVVPIDHALVEGVAHKILPYGHFSLLEADGIGDERYRTVRDFLME